jgi:hypothetical protein
MFMYSLQAILHEEEDFNSLHQLIRWQRTVGNVYFCKKYHVYIIARRRKNLGIRSMCKSFCRWYINITITILDIIHRPVFYLKLNSTL